MPTSSHEGEHLQEIQRMPSSIRKGGHLQKIQRMSSSSREGERLQEIQRLKLGEMDLQLNNLWPGRYIGLRLVRQPKWEIPIFYRTVKYTPTMVATVRCLDSFGAESGARLIEEVAYWNMKEVSKVVLGRGLELRYPRWNPDRTRWGYLQDTLMLELVCAQDVLR